MIVPFARRMLTETDPRLLWTFTWNFGVKGVRSVQKFKQRLARKTNGPDAMTFGTCEQDG